MPRCTGANFDLGTRAEALIVDATKESLPTQPVELPLPWTFVLAELYLGQGAHFTSPSISKYGIFVTVGV